MVDERETMARVGNITPEDGVDYRRLKPHPKNPNEGDIGAVHESIETNGFVVRILAQKSTGFIIDGEHRWRAAQNLGITELPVDWLDCTDEEAERLLAAINRTARLGTDNQVKLAALLSELAQTDLGLKGSGFDGDDLDNLLNDLAGMPPPGNGGDEFDATPTEGPTRTSSGELWRIGSHRLLVGDSTKAEDVVRLMGGAKADMLWTDPPYNVANSGGTKDPRSPDYQSGDTISNDDMPPADFVAFLCSAFASADSVLKEGGVYYIAHPDTFAYEFIGAVRAVKWQSARPAVVQWVKDSFVFGRGDYHAQSEPILYGWKSGAAHHAVADRTQSNVWNIPRPKDSDDHPTMKPVGLVSRSIENSTDAGDLVLDLFLGSGTSLIAAQRTNRRCFGMELSPKFADVILRRAEAEGIHPIELIEYGPSHKTDA